MSLVPSKEWSIPLEPKKDEGSAHLKEGVTLLGYLATDAGHPSSLVSMGQDLPWTGRPTILRSNQMLDLWGCFAGLQQAS